VAAGSVSFFFGFGWGGSNVAAIALVGQTVTHLPQAMHLSWSM
jgi:hypothetical protein